MPRPTKGARLGGSPAHERLILANLATELFKHGKIRTTETKAKRLRPLAEKLITKARKGDMHNRRQVLTVVKDKGVVHHLFTDIAAQMAERPGGYTRITKIGARKGDNAPMAVIELVSEALNPVRVSQGAPAAAAAAPAAAADEDTVEETPADETASSEEAASSEETASADSADSSDESSEKSSDKKDEA